MSESVQYSTLTARTPVVMRSGNLHLILDACEQEERLSRTRLVTLTGLSAMTVQRAVRWLCLKGILTEQRAPDPHTGRQCGVLSPAPLTPILIMDLSVRPMTAHLLHSPLFLPAYCPVQEVPTVTYDPWEEFTTEDNLRLFLARVRQQLILTAPEDIGYRYDSEKQVSNHAPLTRRQRVMLFRMAIQQAYTPRVHGFHPVLLLPPGIPAVALSRAFPDMPAGAASDGHHRADSRCARSTSIRDTREQLIRVVTEELEHPDCPMYGGLTVTDTRAASLYALSHSTQSAGHTSMLALFLGKHADCFLAVRRHVGSDWFIPDCVHLSPNPSITLPTDTDPSGRTSLSPTETGLSAWLASCLRTVHPQALCLELSSVPHNSPDALCLPDILPGGCCLSINQTSQALPLCVRGAAMMARRKLWNIQTAMR